MLRQWAGEPAWWVVIGLQVGVAYAAACLFGHARWRRVLVGALALGAFAIPWLAPPETPLLRAVLALFAVLPLVKSIELGADRREHSIGLRVWHFTSPFDARRARRVQPGVDWRALGKMVLHAAVAVTGLAVATIVAPDLGPVAREVAWVGGGVMLTYGGVDASEKLLRFAHRLAGWEIPRVQLDPVRSRSVQEFWGARWNRQVSNFFTRFCFWPLAREGWPELGRTYAFVMSAALHAWLVWVAVGPRAVLAMSAFFLAQGGFVALERRLSVDRWPRAAAHAWTAVLLLGSSPLFVYPAMSCYGLTRAWG